MHVYMFLVESVVIQLLCSWLQVGAHTESSMTQHNKLRSFKIDFTLGHDSPLVCYVYYRLHLFIKWVYPALQDCNCNTSVLQFPTDILTQDASDNNAVGPNLWTSPYLPLPNNTTLMTACLLHWRTRQIPLENDMLLSPSPLSIARKGKASCLICEIINIWSVPPKSVTWFSFDLSLYPLIHGRSVLTIVEVIKTEASSSPESSIVNVNAYNMTTTQHWLSE